MLSLFFFADFSIYVPAGSDRGQPSTLLRGDMVTLVSPYTVSCGSTMSVSSLSQLIMRPISILRDWQCNWEEATFCF